MRDFTRFDKSNEQERILSLILLAIATITILRLWVLPLNNSLWLDESLIVWIIRDSFLDALARASASPQSVLFSALEWVVRHFGSSAIVLRLPSLGAAIGATYIYYKIGAEFLDREAGVIFAAVYLTLKDVAIQAVSVRPYSLALLAEAAALLWFLRWVRTGKTRHVLLWAVCSAVASHLHFFFALPVVIEGAYALWRMRYRASATVRQLVQFAIVYAALLSPAIPQLAMLVREGSSLSISSQVTSAGVLVALVPIWLVCGTLVMAVLSLLEGDRSGWGHGRGTEIPMLGAALLSPVPLFAILSVSTDLLLFDARYLLPTVPGMVLLWGWVFRGIGNTYTRLTSVAASVILFTMFMGNDWPRISLIPHYGHEDWRSADRSLDSSSALLVYSSLVETRRLEQLRSPEKWGYLMAPVLVYRPEFTPRDAFTLPFYAGPRDQAYVGDLLNGQLRERKEITLIARDIFSAPVWDSWLADRLRSEGYSETRASKYGTVEVRVYTRPSVAASLSSLD